MKINVLNTFNGLIPLTDSDYDQKKELKIGKIYSILIKEQRNYEFLKKYFALINTGWAYLNETQTVFFHNSKDGFRKTVQVAAGFSEKYYSISRNEWIEESKSISFDNMDEIEFRDLYNKVKDVIFSLIEGNVSEQEFMNNLSNF